MLITSQIDEAQVDWNLWETSVLVSTYRFEEMLVWPLKTTREIEAWFPVEAARTVTNRPILCVEGFSAFSFALTTFIYLAANAKKLPVPPRW